MLLKIIIVIFLILFIVLRLLHFYENQRKGSHRSLCTGSPTSRTVVST